MISKNSCKLENLEILMNKENNLNKWVAAIKMVELFKKKMRVLMKKKLKDWLNYEITNHFFFAYFFRLSIKPSIISIIWFI